MKTHYDPFNDEFCERGYCNTYLNEDIINVTSNFKEVTCKKCIKLKDSADKEVEQYLESEIEFMSGFINFTENE